LKDSMVLAIALTMFISMMAFSAIRLLDKLEDFFKDSSDVVLVRTITGDKYVYADMGSNCVRLSSQKRSQFVMLKGRKNDTLMLKYGSTHVLRDGGLGTDRGRHLEKVEQQFAEHVRTRIVGDLFELVPQSTKGAKTIEVVIEQVIAALGTLVGFGWEQCFDQAVESLSDVMPMPHVSKLLLGLFCVIIIVPAWKWYVLPMSEAAGWKFGFVIDHKDEKWDDVVAHLHKMRTDESGEVAGPAKPAPGALQGTPETTAQQVRALPQVPQLQLPPSPAPVPQLQLPSAPAPQRQEVPAPQLQLQLPLAPVPQRQEAISPRSVAAAAGATSAAAGGAYVQLPGGNGDGTGRGNAVGDAATLRGANEEMQRAAAGFLQVYARLKASADEDRRTHLGAYNRQMDAMLSRMRTLHSQIAGDSPSTPRQLPAPSPRQPPR